MSDGLSQSEISVGTTTLSDESEKISGINNLTTSPTITPNVPTTGLKSVDSVVQLAEGKRKLTDLLESREITLSEYLDSEDDYRIYHIKSLGDIDKDILEYLFDEYFKPVSREGKHGFPPISDGFVRLFRGEQPYDLEDMVSFEGRGGWWTQYLDYAANYAKVDGGKVYLLDVPERVVQNSTISRVDEKLNRPVGGKYAFTTEFYIPAKYTNEVKGTDHLLNPTVVDDLLSQGEFTQYGVSPHIKYSDYTESQKELRTIRSNVLNLAGDDIYRFWAYNKYENNPVFRQKHQDDPFLKLEFKIRANCL